MENLTRKAQHQEVELDRTTKELKEAIAIASEETAKCKAAKEVIKSLSAQVQTLTPRPTFKNYIPTTPTSSYEHWSINYNWLLFIINIIEKICIQIQFLPGDQLVYILNR